MHVLFICSRNKLRSPTAEKVFANEPGFEVLSAGTSKDAVEPLTAELIEWADYIFVMEKRHSVILSRNFKTLLKNKHVECLDIPDRYNYMDPQLIQLLESKLRSFFTKHQREH